MRIRGSPLLTFLRILPTMTIFWILLALIFVSLLLGEWLFRSPGASGLEINWFAFFATAILSLVPTILLCYHLYTKKLPLPSDKKQLLYIARNQLLSVLPIVVGSIVGVYLISQEWFGGATVVFLLAFISWFTLRRRLR
jgi:hypothetical protein